MSQVNRVGKYILKTFLWGCLIITLGGALLVLPWRWATPPTTAFMLTELMQTGQRPAYRWVSLEEIAPCMGIAVVASEDQKFPNHYGFDLESIADALEEPPGSRRGASTITQQVAKNLYLWGGRSYVRKGIEAWLTVLIELFWPKRRILEVYLNIAEFGPGVYGVGEASRRLRGKPASRLSLQDCTVLAAVLPSPRRLSAEQPSPYVRRRAVDILMEVYRLGGTRYLSQL